MTGLVILLVVEIGGLVYADRSYLQENTGDIKVQQITSSVASQAANLKLNLDPDAKNVKVSYDGGFLSYTSGGQLVVMDLSNGKMTTVAMDEGMTLGYYQWVYDRDSLIIAEMDKSTSSYYAKLYNLDASELETDPEPVEIRNTVDNTEARITMPTRNSYISGMDFSTSTVMIFLKITNGVGDSTMWKFNVPDENRAYNISPRKIGTIQCLKDDPELLYENDTNGRVYVAGVGSLYIDDSSQFRLLGFDSNDNVYLAKGDGDTTDTIYYGSLEKQGSNGEDQVTLEPDLTKLTLAQSVSVDSIHVTMSGGIYYDDTGSKEFVNLKGTGSDIAYKGDVESVYGNGFITVDGGLLRQNSLD